MEKFNSLVVASHPTGSRYICNPPVLDTDKDTVILIDGYEDWQSLLEDEGWEPCGDYNNNGNFVAYRKGEENYIITEDKEYYMRYVYATRAAKAVNLLNKEDRIKLFEAVLDTYFPREVRVY